MDYPGTRVETKLGGEERPLPGEAFQPRFEIVQSILQRVAVMWEAKHYRDVDSGCVLIPDGQGLPFAAFDIIAF
jgi:hypothetical protein